MRSGQAKVHLAAGLPLTWHLSVQGKAPVELYIAVATQKEDFQKYLLQNQRPHSLPSGDEFGQL